MKLVSDVHAMEAMCRTHVPTIPVQGQGQACRSNGRFGRLLYWHPNTLLELRR